MASPELSVLDLHRVCWPSRFSTTIGLSHHGANLSIADASRGRITQTMSPAAYRGASSGIFSLSASIRVLRFRSACCIRCMKATASSATCSTGSGKDSEARSLPTRATYGLTPQGPGASCSMRRPRGRIDVHPCAPLCNFLNFSNNCPHARSARPLLLG